MTDQQPITQVYQAPNNAFFVELLKHEEFLDRFEHFLRGEVLVVRLDKQGNPVREEWERRYPPKMNNYGINEVMSFMRPICESKIIAMTEFDDDEIDKLQYTNIQGFTDLLVENYDTFEFKSISGLHSVVVSGINIIMAQLRRSKGGSTLDAFTTHTQVTETRQMPVQEEKTSLFKRIPFFGRKEPGFKV